MVNLQVVAATRGYAKIICRNMALDDWQECVDLGVWPEAGVLDSLERSVMANVLLIDERPAAIWGVVGCLIGGAATAWMITTPLTRRAPVACAKIAQREMKSLLTLWPVLKNLVSVKHVKALRFLQAIGFKAGDVYYAGRSGVPFQAMEMRA